MAKLQKPQAPAEGIACRGSWGDLKNYEVLCQCGDPAHSHSFWIEADDAGVSTIVYTQVKSKWWSQNRWQTIWTLLTKGYVEYEASLIMTEQQALNYAETLKKGIKDVEDARNNRLRG